MIDTLQAGLYIVATPIGNLQDITFRAADVLRRADAIAAEDSRVTAKLLGHLEIRKPIIRYDDHSDADARARIVDRLGEEVVALVSDAGTPLISDPGFKLVREAKAAGHYVTTLPGPSAAIAALTLSGLPTDRFLFAGFLPAKAKARDDAIAELSSVRATLLLYESGPRLGKTLAALADGLGNREAAVVREITKRFEESATGSLAELAERYADAPPKGEIVIVVGPPEADAPPDEAAIETALAEALERLAPGKAASDVAKRFGLKRGDLYDRALSMKAGK